MIERRLGDSEWTVIKINGYRYPEVLKVRLSDLNSKLNMLFPEYKQLWGNMSRRCKCNYIKRIGKMYKICEHADIPIVVSYSKFGNIWTLDNELTLSYMLTKGANTSLCDLDSCVYIDRDCKIIYTYSVDDEDFTDDELLYDWILQSDILDSKIERGLIINSSEYSMMHLLDSITKFMYIELAGGL